MKIAFFTDNYLPQPSGVATSVDYFARSLRKNGHIVYIFAPKVRNFKDANPHVFRLPSFRVIPSLPDGARIPLPNKHLSKMITQKFDIIHAHGNGAFSLLGLGVAKARKLPYITTFHIQVDSFAHYFFKGKLIKPKLMNRLFLKRFAQLCDGVIAPSEKMKNQLIQAGVDKNIAVIPNFVDLDKFKDCPSNFLHQKFNVPSSSPILLSVGRVGKEKNFAFLIRCFKLITDRNQKVHLVIVGPDWGETKKLKKLTGLLKIRRRVHFLGKVKPSDMPKVYQEASIFIFASKAEVHPMVAIEAASSSLPLVVLDDPAYRGIVEHQRNGFLAKDEKSFVRFVLNLLDNPAKLSLFGRNSLIIVKKNYGSNLLTKKLLGYYLKTIKNYQRLT